MTVVTAGNAQLHLTEHLQLKDSEVTRAMSALAWLAIPVVALVLAVAWVAWSGRERPRVDTHDSLLAHQRFKAAFERPLSSPPPTRDDAERPHDVHS
jgi:hypothetical protein